MKKSARRKLQFLEDSLRLDLSIVEEIENSFELNSEWTITDLNGKEIVGSKKLIVSLFAFLMLVVVLIFQLPFLLIINLFILFDAIRNGIPFEIIPFLLPAKRIALIDNKIKIEIRHNEHPPPHFHIIINDQDYSMEILTGRFLYNEIKDTKHKKAVGKWYSKNKKLLIRTWNETRPSDCPVGKIKETSNY